MAQLAVVENGSVHPAAFAASLNEPRPSRLLARFCRDIGVAAVADALEIPTVGLEPELVEAIRRGTRFPLRRS